MLKKSMAAACFRGLIYFTLIFSLAFVTGAARGLVVEPRLGAATAVLLEVPVLILASWIIARHLLRDGALTLPQCAVMGATAFTLTMGAEASLSAIMRGQSLGEWAAAVASPIGLVGLAGQLAFGLMPVFFAKTRVISS